MRYMDIIETEWGSRLSELAMRADMAGRASPSIFKRQRAT